MLTFLIQLLTGDSCRFTKKVLKNCYRSARGGLMSSSRYLINLSEILNELRPRIV